MPDNYREPGKVLPDNEGYKHKQTQLCWACATRARSLLSQMNENHLEDCPCYYCWCNVCNTAKMDPEIWVNTDGTKIPINDLTDAAVRLIVKSMNGIFENSLERLDKEDFFDKDIIKKLDGMGPGSIFAQYNRVVAEKQARVVNEKRFPNLDLDVIKSFFRRDKDAKD